MRRSSFAWPVAPPNVSTPRLTAMIDANTSQQLDQLILVHTAGSAQTHAAIDEVTADSPVATVKTAGRYTQDQADQVNDVLNLLCGLLGVSILVELVGIMNTLELSILERTREIGLRAVGMTRRQVWSTIRYEAAIVALLGTTLGVALGCPPPWLASRAVEDTFPVFAMPWRSLIVIVAAGLACGILARALLAPLDVLAAIASE